MTIELPMSMIIDNKVELIVIDNENAVESENLVVEENAPKNLLVDDHEAKTRNGKDKVVSR